MDKEAKNRAENISQFYCSGKDVIIFLHMFPKKRICVSPIGELGFNSRELYYQQQRNM